MRFRLEPPERHVRCAPRVRRVSSSSGGKKELKKINLPLPAKWTFWLWSLTLIACTHPSEHPHFKHHFWWTKEKQIKQQQQLKLYRKQQINSFPFQLLPIFLKPVIIADCVYSYLIKYYISPLPNQQASVSFALFLYPPFPFTHTPLFKTHKQNADEIKCVCGGIHISF